MISGSKLASNLIRVEEPSSESDIVIEKTPLGMRLTLMFLRLLALAMFVPLLGACLLALMSLILGVSVLSSFPKSLLFSLIGLGAFILVLTMMTGIAWLESHLNQSDVPFASSWVATRPGHPARRLVLPAVGSVALYGYLAVLSWIVARIDKEGAPAIGWPLTWGTVAIGATFLLRYLRRRLPG